MMSQSKQKPSTGFRRGFLLSSNKKSNKRAPPKPEATVSSALLDVEQDSSPLLFVSEIDHSSETTISASQTINRPLHVMVSKVEENKDDNNELGLTAISTKRKSPLIQQVPENDDDRRVENHVGPSLEVAEEKPLLWEIPSSPSTSAIQPVTLVHASPPEPGTSEEEATLPKIHSFENNTLTLLAHELPTLLWKLKQHRRTADQEQSLVQQFVSQHIQTDKDWRFAWKLLLKLIVQDSSTQMSPPVQLGLFLLQQEDGLNSFIPFLNPNNDKQSRLLTMGGAQLVTDYCQSVQETKTPVTNKVWLIEVIPKLAKIVMESPTKRSVLSHQCITAAYDILAMAAKQEEDGIPRLNLSKTLWDAMSIVDQLLQVQHGWISKSIPAVEVSSTATAEASRKKCTLAVLSDWSLIIKEALRSHECILINGAEQDDDALANLTEYLCLQLKGEPSDGIEPPGFGGLHQTLSSQSPKLTAEQIVSCMQAGVELLQSMREKKESDEIQSWQRERVRTILRGVAAWLGQTKKHLHSLTKSAGKSDSEKTYLYRATDLCLKLLRCDTDQAVALVLTILGCLWSSNSGLPPDFLSHSDSASTSVPLSFELLLDELNRNRSNALDTLDPTDRALCLLVTRCILFRGPSLVNELVKRNGVTPSTVEILASVLSETGQSGACDSEAQSSINDGDLRAVAGSAFLDCIGSSHFAQQKLRSSPELLCSLPMVMVVPRLVSAVSANMDRTDVVTAILPAITWILVSSLPDKIDELVRVIIESINRCDEVTMASDDDQNLDKLDAMPSSKLCRKIAGSWRRTLLDNPACDVNALAEVLSAIAKAMFADPSSSVPLTLFGSVVGDDLSLQISNNEQASSVFLAMKNLINQSVNGLCSAASVDSETDDAGNIYSRLSPLLLLRRLPVMYFKVAWRASSKDRESFELMLSKLADQLADRLSIPGHLKAVLSPEERRLAAEIAGRCLPFCEHSSPTSSCYERICVPAFSSALRTFSAKDESATSSQESLRTARAALYTCCTHIPLADDDESGEGVFGTVSFVLRSLNVDVADYSGETAFDEDGLIQLQTGCIEFIAVCLESTLQRHMTNEGAKTFAPIVEVSDSPTVQDAAVSSIGEGTISTKEALAVSCNAITSLLRVGAPIPSQLCLRNNGFVTKHSNDTNQDLSTSTRTCLWNACLVVSQRCPDDGRLKSWANITAPWVLDWASVGAADDYLRHPLCMAAALQVIFILVTRTKSFDCLAGGKVTPTSVRKAHRLAVTSCKTETNIGGVYARMAMRKAALKLLLALVTIDQMDEENSISTCLSPGELGEAFTLLNGTANVDADAEVRALAIHILRGMRAS